VPVLTGLTPDPRQAGYRVVELDGQRFASVPAEPVEALNLKMGTTLSEPAFERLRELADIEAAWRAAIRTLATRARARADLGRRLAQKQHPPAVVDQVLARLEAHGLVDDRRFAVDYAARLAARGRGPARLLTDLLAQGVERRVAESGVKEGLAAEGVDPDGALRRVAERRARQLAGLAATARKRRLLAFLARRGYRGSEARAMVEELCNSP
jgi:regulatory protein